jgi:protein-tyrosine phosphatase
VLEGRPHGPPYPTLHAVIDLHAHILPGLDDGAQTLEDSRELAHRAFQDGITAIAATPHVRADYPTTAGEMERGVDALRNDFRAQGIAIDVLHGGEIALEMLDTISREDLARFTLAQGDRYLLLEFPYVGWPLGIERRIFELRAAGLTPILAHPERNGEVQSKPERLAEAVRVGALVQITAASLDGRLGKSSRDAAERLLELRLVHLLASDAHTPDVRVGGLAEAAARIRDDALARYLTEGAPAAVVAGQEVPQPPPKRRRGLTRRLGA